MAKSRSSDDILQEIAAIPTLERGKLCPFVRGERTYYNLQFWDTGRNRCEYVPVRQLPAVREAVANYARYQDLVAEYAAMREQETRENRQAADPAVKKTSRRKSRS